MMAPAWHFAYALWIGVEREWPHLSTAEREAVRTFIKRPIEGEYLPSPDLFGRLLDLDKKEAKQAYDSYYPAAYETWMHQFQMASVAVFAAQLNLNVLLKEIHEPHSPF